MLPGVVFGQVFTGRGQVDSNDAQFATADSNCMHDTPDLEGCNLYALVHMCVIPRPNIYRLSKIWLI